MSRDKNFADYFFDSKHSTSHGSSKFAGFWEQRKLLKKSNTGIFIADDLRLTPNASFSHLCYLAPTGAGKTTRYILNQALGKWNHNSSLIFFDPSSEIYNLSASWLRRKQKMKVIKIDLTNGQNSECFNPLLQITDKNSARIMAQSLMNIVYADAKSDPFWVNSAIGLLTLIILAVINTIPAQERTLSLVNRLVNKFGHSQDEINALMEVGLNDDDFEEFASFLNNSDKVKKSIISTIKSSLYVYSDDVLKQVSRKNTFQLSDLRDNKTALFLIQDEHKIPYFKSWWNLFFRLLFEELMTSSEGNDVYCFMDEFANFGKIENFESIISTIRKKRVHLSLVLQSFEQLSNIYGQNIAKIIMDNCTSKVFLSGLSYESSKIVSAMLGQKTESFSAKGIYKRHQNLERVSRLLLTPDEVRTMDENECLFINTRYNPMKLACRPFYKNRRLIKRSKL
mgnify:FL=1